MDRTETYLLDALRCSVCGKTVRWSEPLSPAEQRKLIQLALIHNVLPLVAEAIYGAESLTSAHNAARMRERARNQTIFQAQRTAEFLLLYEELVRRGLGPTVMKGVVLRSLYPQPEQRFSVDEDMLVSEAAYPPLHDALISCGLYVAGDPAPDAEEVTYLSDERHLYLEVHKRPFASDSDAYGDCNAPFVDALERTVTVQIEGIAVRTLAPTDHLLYLICHAYKHFLHSGVGIRQVCDMGLFAQRYGSELDWDCIASACRELRIERFAAALFRIGEKYLGFDMPAALAGYGDDPAPLLEDILSGGVYGAEDINRLHSSTLTLDAVAAHRTGKRRGGVMRSVFLPAKSLVGRYPYLRRQPWLLPVAWTQRICSYLIRQKKSPPVHPAESIRIGRERIALLHQYGIIE